MRKLLILGNGFDLAHGLPTKYSHFLDFCYMICLILRISQANVNEVIDIFINKLKSEKYDDFDGLLYCFLVEHLKKSNISTNLNFDESKIRTPNSIDCKNNKILTDLHILLKNNIWYEHLKKMYLDKKIKGENWIDFESEISYIIQVLDRNSLSLSHSVEYVLHEIDDNSIDFIDKFKPFIQLIENYKLIKITIRDLRKRLFEDLQKLSKAFEIYLSEFVSKKYIELYSPDIKEIEPDYVINFNYTNTYSKIYYSLVPEFHIHGVCRNDVLVGKNNMVLGIDEYWSTNERDDHTNFTIFKKFAQRIQKRTGIEHEKIYDEMKSYNSVPTDEANKVYIFGHSLDITDKDILKMFFDEDFVVTIFCRDEETEGEYIANVIKIIGEDELIKRVNQNPPALNFIIQSPIVQKSYGLTLKPDLEEEEEEFPSTL